MATRRKSFEEFRFHGKYCIKDIFHDFMSSWFRDDILMYGAKVVLQNMADYIHAHTARTHFTNMD